MIKQSSIDELLKQLDTNDVLRKMNASKIKDFGDSVRAFCPIHGSDNQRSMKIHIDNNVGYCYNTGCRLHQEGWQNIIEIYSLYRNIKFNKAAVELAKNIGFKLEYDNTTKKERKSKKSLKEEVYKFIEAAHSNGKGFNRNELIKIPEIQEWQAKHKKEDCYRSVVQYGDNELSNLYPKKKGSSPIVTGNFPMDFDNPVHPKWNNPSNHLKNTVFKDIRDFKTGLKCCLLDAKAVIEKQLNDFDFPEDAITPSTSGAGIHTETDFRAFGIEPMYEEALIEFYQYIFYVLAEVNTEAEKVALEWNPEKDKPAKTAYSAKYQTVDPAMYTKRRLWRLANSVNTKNGLYKVNIPLKQFLKHYKDPDWFLSYAKEPKAILTFPNEMIPASKAVNLFENGKEIHQQQMDKKKEAELKAKEEAEKIKLPETAWRGRFKKWREIYSPTSEAADEFLFAGLLTVTGAMLGRRVWIWQASNIYPNIYSVIIGKSAKARKTTAANYSEQLLKKVDKHVIFSSGISTTQGLIGLLQLPSESEIKEYQEAQAEADNELEEPSMNDKIARYMALEFQDRLEYEGFRLLYYEREFSRLLKKTKKDYSSDFVETLQEAYDMKDELDNHSFTNPISAEKPCISVISTTTFGKLQRHLENEEIEGGFANRFMYFIGDRKPPKPRPPKPDKALLTELMSELNEIRQKWNHTEFTMTKEAEKIWDEFYCKDYETESATAIIDHISSRFTTHAIKLALIFAATENDKPFITAKQVKTGIDIVEYLRKCAIEIFALQGGSKYSKIERLITDFLKKSRSATVTKIWRHVRKEMSGTTTKEIQNTLNSLQKMEAVRKKQETFKDSAGRKQKRTVYKIRFV